jgi:hypothetical protein
MNYMPPPPPKPNGKPQRLSGRQCAIILLTLVAAILIPFLVVASVDALQG